MKDIKPFAKKYPSKIILLGEYGVIHGGPILASPLMHYSAKWVKEKPKTEKQKTLLKIHDYLLSKKNSKINLHDFRDAIESGLHLSSNIPSGYGLGSSGSITAGIYDLFAYEKITELHQLKQDLIEIESCFHGVSSGIDPLVIYLNSPVYIVDNNIEVLENPVELDNYFLIDTKAKRKTSPLVDIYLQRAQKSSFQSEIEKYKQLNHKAIDAQLSGDKDALVISIAQISQWQYQNLDFAILDNYKKLWQSTLDRSDISLKHCGAGGGGFILGYAEDVASIAKEFKDQFDLIPLV